MDMGIILKHGSTKDTYYEFNNRFSEIMEKHGCGNMYRMKWHRLAMNIPSWIPVSVESIGVFC